MKKRADLILVERRLAGSRTKAQELISAGFVSFVIAAKIKAVRTSNETFDTDTIEQVVIEENSIEKFVSRAGLKLAGALEKTQLHIQGKTALDVGISTGGFTDCLFSLGMKSVVGVEVGHDQTHPKLRQNPNLTIFEGLNAKDLQGHLNFKKSVPQGGFDLVVMDVSFISVSAVLASVIEFAGQNSDLLILVKPQFEAGPSALDKNGIIKDAKLYTQILTKVSLQLEHLGCKIEQQFESFPAGKDGNREFFIWAKKL